MLVLGIIFVVLLLSTTSGVIVGSGSANLTIYVNSTGGQSLQDVNLTLLNGSFGAGNATYIYNTQSYTDLTNGSGEAVFINLSILDNYSVSGAARGYYLNISPAINVSDGTSPVASVLNMTLSPDSQPPAIVVSGTPTPPNGGVVSGSSTSFSVDFDVSDDLETEEINVSLYLAKGKSGFSYNTSGLFSTGSRSLSIASISGNGNYSWYLNASDYMNNSDTTSVRRFYIDTADPNATGLSLTPGSEQNASQAVNLSASINGTFSYLDYIRFYADDVLIKEDNLDSNDVMARDVSWGYLLPDSAAGTTIDLHYCFADAGLSTSEVCTTPASVYVTDNKTPSIDGFSVADQFIRSDATFGMMVNATDASDTDLQVNISFFNGTHVLNSSTTTHTSDAYSFSLVPSLREGNYTLNISATDDFNNTARNQTWVVIDDTAPDVAQVNISDTTINQGTVITIRAHIVDLYDVDLDDFTVGIDMNYSGYQTQAMEYVGDDVWEQNVTMAFAGDSDIFVNVTAQDLSGNTGWNDTRTITVDNTPITVTINEPQEGLVVNGSSNATVGINYSLGEISASTTLSHAGLLFTLPTATEVNYSFNMSYPGKQTVAVIANDSADNSAEDSVTFYADFLLNSSKWTTKQLAASSDIASIAYLNLSRASLPEMINVSVNATNSTMSMDINFSNGIMLNLSGVDLYESELAYDLVLETDDATFKQDYADEHGAAVIDMLRMQNLAALDLENLSLTFRYNTSEFEEIYYCTDDHRSCTAISKGTSDSLYYHQENQSNVTVVYTGSLDDLSSSSAFILANDTVAPTITVSSPVNNTVFSTAFGNTIDLSLNEPAQCTYSVNSSSGHYTGSVGSGYISALNDFTLPAPPYDNGEHQFNITCDDANSNTGSLIYHYQINDTTAPSLTIDPENHRSFDKGTSSVTITVTTSKPALCKYNTSSFTMGFPGTQMSSSDHIEHSLEVDTEDGESYRYYLACSNFNGVYYSTYVSFSISDQAVPASSEGSSNLLSNYTYEGDEDENDIYVSEEFTYLFLAEGNNATIDVADADIPVRRFLLGLAADLRDVTFSVESFSSSGRLPSGVSPVDNAFRYIRLSNDKSDDMAEISGMHVTFRIPGTWIADHDLTHDDVLLQGYDSSEGAWKPLAKTFEGVEDDHFIYTSASSNTSLFSIAHKKNPAPAPPEQEEEEGNDSIQEIDEETTRQFTSQKLGDDQVSAILFIIVVSVFGSLIVYVNRHKLVGALAGKGTAADRSKGGKEGSADAKGPSSAKKKRDGGAPDVKSIGKVKLDEASYASSSVAEAHPDVLKGYLFTLFRNVWVRGFNDASIRKSMLSEGWSEEQVMKALQHVWADAKGKSVSMPDPEIKPLLDSMRMKMNTKYGFTSDELYTTLKENGWPGYMIDSALKALQAMMTTPYSYVHSFDTEPMERYITEAKAMGAEHDDIESRLIEAGWPRELVETTLRKYSAGG
ncbi:MAG: PGF-pre-PGF domain-containing protein [Nanoarchaeota archaeon]